jgi:serine/threonine protein kinase
MRIMAAAEPLTEVDSPPADREGEILGDFQLIKKLGEGGMGAVYKAHQISMDRPVALKILAPQLSANPEFVKRFRREAQMSARLDHINVIRGFTVGEEKGVHYFAMEFVDGKNLSELMTDMGSTLDVPDAVKITIDVARALEQAAQRGLVHRDIKPANIMVTNERIVKLADLGLAKVTTTDEGDLTATGVFFGTPPYMPPEQVRNPREVDGRSDIYSLGATLYYLLAGQKPFQAKSMYEVLEAKEKGNWKPASTLNAAVPVELDRIIAKTMEPNAADRYQTATALITDLEASGLAGRTLMLGSNGAGGATMPTSSMLTHPTTPSVARGLQSRSTLAAGLVVLVLIAAAFAIYQQWGQAPTTVVSPPQNPPTAIVSQSISRILTRAYGELAGGQLDNARAALRTGLERNPTAAALERPLRELEKGALVLVQYQTPEETLPLAPVIGHEDLTLTQKDNYRFAIVTTRPCFFYAFNVDKRPSVSRLFPNSQFSALQNPIPDGKVHWLPDGETVPGGGWLHLDEFQGVERVYFVGLTRPLRDSEAFGERLLADASATVVAMTKSPGEFVGAGAEAVASCFAEGGPVQEFEFRHE